MEIFNNNRLELFTIKCRSCNSRDVIFYVASDKKLIIECDKCNELEEIEIE